MKGALLLCSLVVATAALAQTSNTRYPVGKRGGGGGGGTLQLDYTAGGAGGGRIGLSSSGGPLECRDNATPLSGPLLKAGDSTGANTYFSASAAAAQAAVCDFFDGQSAAVSIANHGSLIYNNNLHCFQVSTNGGPYACISLGGGGGVGVEGAYSSGASSADEILQLNATLGGFIVRDNSTPLGATLIGAQNVNGASKYFDVKAASTTVTTLPNGGGTVAKLVVDNGLGARLEYGSFILLDGNHLQITPNLANGTYGGIIITPGGLTSAGAELDGQLGTGNVYFACASGLANIPGAECEDVVADTSGTTVNLLAAWSSADKVQVPAATANLHTIAGVALNTAAAAATVHLMTRGRVQVGCDGTIAVGDLLVSSGTTAGRVIANNSATAGTIVGKATETCASNLTVANLNIN